MTGKPLVCATCQQPTTHDHSRVRWLKSIRQERRVCHGCLERLGLPKTKRTYTRAERSWAR